VSSRRKIAFIFSSNGPANLNPLKYAIEDADRIAKALSSPNCGFRVVRPSPGSDPFDLRRQLFTVTESCKPEDSLICYFSGHGVLEKGNLFLLWDDTDVNRPISTAIPISDVLQALQYCNAKGKLLILDCCHAGAAAGKIGLKNAAGIPVSDTNLHADNHLVLMASGRVEQARELRELVGRELNPSSSAAQLLISRPLPTLPGAARRPSRMTLQAPGTGLRRRTQTEGKSAARTGRPGQQDLQAHAACRRTPVAVGRCSARPATRRHRHQRQQDPAQPARHRWSHGP
jgi:hypothetical protein